MGPLNLPLLESEDIAWFRDDDSLPASTRGAAAALARRLGFDEVRCAEVALAVSEAASNLRKHAVDGALLLRVVRTEQDAGLEFVTTDEGPGMADVAGCLVDGSSSAGTLGIGLGAIVRLADTFDVHSLPGKGTAMSARFWTKDARAVPPPWVSPSSPDSPGPSRGSPSAGTPGPRAPSATASTYRRHLPSGG